ncbi:hypothetical protein RB595_001315 [Gaeumannomyces hyphopodioides]
MPTAKRLRSGRQPQTEASSSRSATEPRDRDSEFAHLARQHWLKSSTRAAKVKVKNDVLKKEIWGSLERENFQHKSLLALESLQLLESYLWPGYVEDASQHHVLLIVFVANTKRRERLDIWPIFEDRPTEFSSLFRRVLSISLDQTLTLPVRMHVLSFIIYAFQSLDCAIVRKECAPLVSISTWHNLSTAEKRDGLLDQDAQLRKAWRASAKRYDAADDATKARLRFERMWLYTLILDFFRLLHDQSATPEHAAYCERFTELLIDLQSQLPTRRYVNTLLRDLHVLAAIRLSPVYCDEDSEPLRELHGLLQHYTLFTINDHTGVQLSRTEAYDQRCTDLARLQRVALKHFKDKLTVLALSNYGSIGDRGELEVLLGPLTDDELVELASRLQLRTSYPSPSNLAVDRKLLMEVLLSMFEKRPTFQETLRDMPVLPTERTLFEQSLQRADSYDGVRPLALPKLNLQYLSVGDFLWRAYVLYRCEAFYGIRKDIETALQRLKPQSRRPGETSFGGSSRMALPITKPSIIETVPALVGDDTPSLVRAEVGIDLRHMPEATRRDWEALRPDDVVFLLAVDAAGQEANDNGELSSGEPQRGLRAVRTAEVIQVFDDRGRPVRDPSSFSEGHRRSPMMRIQLRLDAKTYKADAETNLPSEQNDVYSRINVLLRRSGRENNFKPVLESIRSLSLSDVPLAPWLHEVFLGYGDPAAATYKLLPNRIKKLDFRDTFLDWQHLVESLPGRIVEPGDDVSGSFGPPYVLETLDRREEDSSAKPSKKRRRDADPALISEVETVNVSTYKPSNSGPYPIDAPKLNSIRFTPAQIEAIVSGTQPGLTVIVGPPGTGKTDVATQIISNIYHSFPTQRTLLIAHSNQALNQLFAKIVALDIDGRHLLRLGHGEEDLDTTDNFSKAGRVDSFLNNRDRYLQEVSKLAASVGAPGAHGNSAETAGYFNSAYVEPAWARYTDVISDGSSTATDIVAAFPFAAFFSDAPQPLFPEGADRETVLGIATGCYRHISKVFSELADVRPFEILRRDKDKANYLLTNEARIIAMTSTHAAVRRDEIASLNFRYDNVVIEEAAQITEMECFIPLAMQKARGGKVPLQRVVLCGDHYQNSPVIQSLAFRHYANLEQSFFSRLVRLGVPTINLDQQGRARPSIASLYSWRYNSLGNLPHVESSEEFSVANAGFRYDYQFIDVPDYRGHGESEPTPHFIQNLGEAEYAVAIYQYMRLLGYPASKISILTTYAGQRALVKDVLAHRCAKTPIFGLPKVVTTVDKYQGEQNDCKLSTTISCSRSSCPCAGRIVRVAYPPCVADIILSLTRTSRVGYLRDIRRLTVALSRARLGLYILGRRQVFEACLELRQAFQKLLLRPDKLTLVTGELWPSQRRLSDETDGKNVPGEVVMEGVEHLGQYVYEMTGTKLEQENSQTSAAPPPEIGPLPSPLADSQRMEVVEEADEDEGGGALEG